MAVTDADNPYFYSTLSGTPTTQITDAVDFPHSGLIRALSQGVRGNYAVKTANDFDITFAAATHSTIAVTAGKVYRDGKLHTVSALSALPLNTSYNPGTGAVSLIPISAGDVYLMLVSKDGGSSNDTMVLRGSNGTHSVVPALVEGDVPIAIIKITAGSANGSAEQADRMVQYLTTGKVESSLSVGYNSSGYTETLAIESNSGDTNIIASVADKDINFKGTDGSSDITALQLDMALVGKATFSGAIVSAGTVTATGFTIGSAAITEAELEIIDGATITTAQLNRVDATSSIQTQLDSKAIRTGDQSFGGSLVIDKDRAGSVGAETSKALHVDFDRLAQSTGTAAHNDIGIDLDVTSSSKGTSTAIGMDIDVVGSGTGTQTVKGLTVDVSGGDTNIGMHIKSEGAGDHLILEADLDNAATHAPNLVLYRKGSDTPQTNELIGQIVFRGENNNNQDVNYASIESGMDDVTDGGEDGNMTFNLIEAGTLTEFIRLRAATRSVVINDQQDDIDFRIEGDSADNLFITDASTQRVGINTGSPATTLDIGGNAQITNPDGINATAFRIDNADAGEIALEIIAANTATDVIDITADTVTTANVIDITADGLTDGSALNIISDSASTATRNIAYIKNDHASAVNATTLKLESDTATEASAPVLHVKSASAGGSILLESTTNSADAGPEMHFYRNAGAGTASDDLGALKFYGQDDGNNKHLFAHIFADMHAVTNGSEAGRILIQTFTGTNPNNNIQIEQAQVVVNASGGDINFRHRGDNDDYLIHSDAGLDRVGIGTGSPANKLQITHTGADGSNGLMIVREDATTVDGELLGGIGFDSSDGNVPSSVLESSAFISSFAVESHGPNDKGGNLKFGVSLIDENDDTVSTVLASVGPPDTLANAACHAGFNSRATTAIVAAATYAPTIGDSGTLVIFNHANSNLTLPSVNNTTSVGVQFTVFNQTGSKIESQIATSNSATINGASAGAPNDDIDTFKAATFVCSGNNTWIRIG
tara:strand:- start:430 stop:3435 length:3006 start_codon:yes stop_codon:yes gene_type:complete